MVSGAADNMTAARLAVSIGGRVFKNPVMTASGTFGYGSEFSPYIDLRGLGALVVKGISLVPRKGNPPPRIVETASGMLNAIGLENVGVEAFLAEKLDYLRTAGATVIVNIFGESVEEYRELGRRLGRNKDIAALEVNISCPNVKKGGVAFGTDAKMAREITAVVKAECAMPVIVKLSPNVTDIAAIAVAVEQGGADAVSLVNTFLGMAIDSKTRKPRLANIVGGLSGPAIKPLALRMVWQTARAVSIPVIGIGGICTAEDAVEFLLAGASAVQVGTANFVNPGVTEEILAGLTAYLDRNGMASIRELIGALRLES